MKSLKELYKIGRGPSSSHTMGPESACKVFKKKFPDADEYKVFLYGSLARTGKGHMTDKVIAQTLCNLKGEVIFDTQKEDIPHPNTFDMFAYKNGAEIGRLRVISIGGGDIRIEGTEVEVSPDVYPHKNFAEIAEYCKRENIRLYEYADRFEGEGINDYLSLVWQKMQRSIENGLSKSGILDGGIGVERKAKVLYESKVENEDDITKENRLVCAFSFAVGEENASAGEIVTAPTCGASGVLPAILYYYKRKKKLSDEKIINALKVAGIIGNVVKTNASVSGAECGCQAEIGTACSMASGALSEINGMDIDQTEYSAEVALEHHLGLTCDPVGGLVQIPCIERNAVAAMRAINAVNLATFLTYSRKISFDMVVETMYKTGKDISCRYRETSEGGLATAYKNNKIIREKS